MEYGDFDSRQAREEIRQRSRDDFSEALNAALDSMQRTAETATQVTGQAEGSAESSSVERRSNAIIVKTIDIPAPPLPAPVEPTPQPPLIPALQEPGTSGGLDYPTEPGKYVLEIDEDGDPHWTPYTEPDLPADEGTYVLHVDGDGVLTWIYAYPESDGEYTYTVTGGVGAWTLRRLPPDLPYPPPAEKTYYTLAQNPDGTFEWVAMAKVTLPDCSGDTVVYYEALAVPPPSP